MWGKWSENRSSGNNVKFPTVKEGFVFFTFKSIVYINLSWYLGSLGMIGMWLCDSFILKLKSLKLPDITFFVTI